MATSEKLLSVKNGEKKADTLDANKEDSKVTKVGGPENTWSTAQYANFKFDAATGVSADSTILPDAGVDAEKADTLKEDACPACGEEPCKCDELKEGEPAPSEDEAKAERESGELNSVDEADEPVAPATDDTDEVLDTDEDDDVDTDDETLDLDLSDLIDSDEDVVELPAADLSSDEEKPEENEGIETSLDHEDDDADFNPAGEDKVWEDDEDKIHVDVEDDDVTEGDESEEDTKKDDLTEEDEDDADKKKDEIAEGDESEEDKKKDDLTEEDDEDEDTKKDDLAEEDEPADDEKKDKSMTEGKIRISFKMTEAAKLFKNSTVLTEEDKRQSRVLFESAVRSVAKQIGSQLQEAYQARFDAAKKQHEAKVAKQLDSYLSYVVEQWAKDNKVALQNQLRNRLTESFLAGFKKLCVEHYIEVPESKVNVVEALAKNVKTLKTKLKNAEAQNVKLHEASKEAVKRERVALKNEHKARLIAEASNGVTAADRGEFVQRAQTVKFVTTKEFKKDLVALREQYFVAKKSVERPADEPVAAPIFESKKVQSSVDIYTKVADRLTRQS